MTRLLLLCLALLVVPATASADTTLIRGAFGHGTVTTSHGATRPTPPDCNTPASNPQGKRVDCSVIDAGGFANCTPRGTGNRCVIGVTAVPALGWTFDGWASGPCPPADAGCSFEVSITECTGGSEPTCDPPIERGPWTAIAKFRDTRAPTATLNSGPAQNSLLLTDTRQAPFSFSTDEDDENPTFRCKLDAGAATACTSPFTLTQLADGEHDLCVTPTDASGLAGTAVCRHWEQQTNATAAFTAAPPAATRATGATFTYASNKPGATFECKLDTAAFAPCAAAGTTLAGLPDGAHAFSVRASFHARFDAPGVTHTGPAATQTWTVDTTPPETSITTGPADGSEIVDVAPTFAFGAEPGATFACSVDGGAAAPCASPFTTPPLLAGAHAFAVTATDAVGNTDPTPATRAFTLKTGLGTLVDADHDGYPEALDCNDHAAAIHPGALEIPGNGVDENCDGVVAPFARVAAAISANGVGAAKRTTFSQIVVTGITPGAKVQVLCSGKACPFKAKTLKVVKNKTRLKRFVVGVGATVEVRVTAKDMIGKVARWKTVKNRFATLKLLCLAPGRTKPASC